MKNIALLLLLALPLSFYAQKEKIRGSKIVVVQVKEIGDFQSLEVSDNLEISLEKGAKCGVKIEADDNLQDVIVLELVEKNLKISTTKQITTYKKLIIRVIYTDDFNKVVARDQAIIKALEPIVLNDISFDANDKSELYLNTKVTNFTLKLYKKAIAEVNNTCTKTVIEMNDSSALKALNASSTLKLDMYLKSVAAIEGDVESSVIRIDNNSILRGKNFMSKKTDLLAEGESYSEINAVTSLSLSAADKSEIRLYSEPQITITKFSGETKLIKRLLN